MEKFVFYIDLLGSCNLKCPSCPVGNFERQNSKGFMSLEHLDAILKKAVTECELEAVGLFSWSEPMLYPKLADAVRLVQSYGTNCYLSSNLNIMRHIDDVMAANPYWFRVSTSAFHQEKYAITHRGGDIEVVKQNMVKLAEAKKRAGATTKIQVLYHRYLGNLDDEVEMKKFADSLGFEFSTLWAALMPLEKTLYHAGDRIDGEPLTDEDKQLLDRFALNLDDALEIAVKHKNIPCPLREKYISMDYKGDVQLCNSVFEADKFFVANYLDVPLSEIQSKRFKSDTCTRCMDKGLHVYVNGIPEEEFNKSAMARLSKQYSSIGFDITSTPKKVAPTPKKAPHSGGPSRLRRTASAVKRLLFKPKT